MITPASDKGVNGVALTEKLFLAFEEELPELRRDGVHGWCVYELLNNRPKRTITGVSHQEAYEYAEGLEPGKFIVQGVDVDEPDYDSIQPE